ncbi:MAG: GNAT family N-acetyltransferase [Longicatena sp.]
MLELGVAYFDQVYKIMEEAFPIEERRTYEGQKELLNREDYHVCGIVKDGRVQAFITYYEMEDFMFFEHLATHHTTRGSGVGRKLMLEVFNSFHKDIIFEVELPQTTIAKRRIAFYERMGCVLYPNIIYLQPSFHEGCEPLPLHLMSYPNKMEDDVMKQKIMNIYLDVYHVNK